MDKRTFMLQFILNARRSGRDRDINSERDRNEIVDAAEDLWNKVNEKCVPVANPNTPVPYPPRER